MTHAKLLVVLGLALVPVITVATNLKPDMADTNYINQYVDRMVKDHEAAFVSVCVVHSASADYLAGIVFFPRKNQGMFVFSDKNHVVLNWGDLSWTTEGQWDMGDLEGGTETVKILSDLFYKLTRLPFVWTSPADVKTALAKVPKHSCEMLKR